MSQFKSIFIANLAEIAKPLTKHMSKSQKEEEIFEDHAYCDRFALSSQDDRVLITPFPLDEDLVADINRLLRFKNVLYLHPEKIRDSISFSILEDKKLSVKIEEIIRQNPKIEIESYAATEEFKLLLESLKKKKLKFETPSVPYKNKLWTASFFDSKAGFRQASHSLGKSFPAMPKGIICSRRDELLGWVKYFLTTRKGVVLKSNRGLAGAGLKIIKKEELKPQEIASFVRRLFSKEPFWKKEPVIVEEYIEPNTNVCGGAPNIELKIDRKGLKVLYECGMRISQEGVFMGIELGREAVPKNISIKLSKAGVKFGQLLRQCGYQGYFEIDFVYGKNRLLSPVEANIRRTGGTHAYELAIRLLGKDFMDKYYLLSMNRVEAPRFNKRSYQFVKSKLTDHCFPIKEKKEGVIISIVNYLKKGRLGYVIIGPSKKRVLSIEKSVLKHLT